MKSEVGWQYIFGHLVGWSVNLGMVWGAADVFDREVVRRSVRRIAWIEGWAFMEMSPIEIDGTHFCLQRLTENFLAEINFYFVSLISQLTQSLSGAVLLNV
jgi:hypothetical protein